MVEKFAFFLHSKFFYSWARKGGEWNFCGRYCDDSIFKNVFQIELKRLEASTGDESLPSFAKQLLDEKNEEIDHLNLQVGWFLGFLLSVRLCLFSVSVCLSL